MAWFERRSGCNRFPDPATCWGPLEDYHTLFGTELRFLALHLAAALLIGGALAGALIVKSRRGSLDLHPGASIAIGIAAAGAAFLLLAYLLPVHVDY